MGKWHEVKQGEYVGSIATAHDFLDGRSLYERPENEPLRRKRPNPNVLLPGDMIFVPDRETKHVPCATGQAHSFRVKAPPNVLRVVLRDLDGDIPAGEPFTLTMGSKVVKKPLPADGLVEEEIPPGVTKARLVMDDHPELAWDLDIGHLDPLHPEEAKDAAKVVVRGLQSRLIHLGFLAGEVDGELGPRTKGAIAEAQRVLLGRTDTATGDLDDETCAALLADHGV